MRSHVADGILPRIIIISRIVSRYWINTRTRETLNTHLKHNKYVYLYISNNFFSSISQSSTISQRSSTFHVVRFSFFFGNQRACVHALSFLHPIHSCLSYNAIGVDPIPGPAEVWVGHAKGQSSPCIPRYSATSTTLINPLLHSPLTVHYFTH